MGTKDQKKSVKEHKLKRCPTCFANLPIDAGECPACSEKVGKRNEYGLARKVFAWKSYLICLIAWIILGLYIWWAFF